MQRSLKFLAGAALVAMLAACGGGNDPVAVDPLAEVPPGASQSSAGLTGYVDALAAMPSDSREPVSVDNFNPPQPDNTEPEAVNR